MVLEKTTTRMDRPVGLGAQVAETLTMAILEGEFKGGDQLVEQDLQSHFGVSRSPLREAFRELEKKGLVDIIPRRGTFVKRISRADIEENFPVRAALEGLAARLALAHISEGDLVQMHAVLKRMKSAVKASDTKTYYTQHLVFHELFIQFSANKLLIATLDALRMQSLWHRFSYQYYLEDLQKSFQVHQEIYELFRDPNVDPEKVRTLVEDHINMALGRFIDYLQEFERE
ncbi:MAG: GntR family transcriptional regulator [Desulfobacterales bacterium]|nr:GntR family transcriptional regulator [Desulfobacterales bacterium]